ncbi:MAG: hypothetical protein M3Y33_01160 [Actinomycetota bacterium]|nr:hypothetical protein [Actinomycetota bacterium]
MGTYLSPGEAKLVVPQVTNWVKCQDKHAAWNGWLPGAEPDSPPDYRIELA